MDNIFTSFSFCRKIYTIIQKNKPLHNSIAHTKMYSKLVTHSLPNQNNNQDTKDNHENNCKRDCHNQDNLVQVLTFWVYWAVIHREIGQTGWAPTHFGVRINSDLTDCQHFHVHNVP